jgi:Phospholipase_D-nuclease N-terminal
VIDLLPGLVEIVLLVFCLIDCIQTDPLLVRNLPKIGWILLIVILPIVGGIAWLVAGRPVAGSAGNAVPWRATATAGFPEYERPGTPHRSAEAVDEQLRRDQERVDREHEEALRRWEASLRERERKLGESEPD